MIRLIIIRHAKTAWNKAGRIQGRSDIPLLPESVVAAREEGRRLAGERIDAAYASPLSRAMETAKAIVEGRGIEVHADARLLERDFGKYDGRTYDELGLADHTKLFFALTEDVGAEPSADVFARVRSFVDDLRRTCDGKTVLVVSHGVCISFLVYALTHDEWKESEYSMNYVPNLTACVYELEAGV